MVTIVITVEVLNTNSCRFKDYFYKTIIVENTSKILNSNLYTYTIISTPILFTLLDAMYNSQLTHETHTHETLDFNKMYAKYIIQYNKSLYPIKLRSIKKVILCG